MKKKRLAQSGLFSLRAILAVMLCAAAVFSMFVTKTFPALFGSEAPAKPFERTLTFAERVAYQRAIEEVYWRHRIWPKERPDPKPSVDAVVSQAQVERKVHDYLRKSQALRDYWQQPISGEQLQVEMDRMAKYTRQPEVLRELFDALGNDPFVIAECLARPILAERLFKSALTPQHANDAVYQPIKRVQTTRTRFRGYTLPVIATTSKEEGTCNDAWAATTTNNAPSRRYAHTTVWTGSEMVVWGGFDGQTTFFNTGGRYTPSTDSWAATSITNTPSARASHGAVWTGTEMIVWGGLDDTFNYVNTGGRYNPSSDSWVATATAGAPEARESHTSVWTGNEMIIWGGFSVSGIANTGGKYDPSTDSWTATTTTSAPDGRYAHTAVWTGSEMIVWGGESSAGFWNTGGRYHPSTDSWTTTSTTNTPEARGFHTAVWTGDEMIVWGGYNPSYLNTGGRYNPSTDSWTATSTSSAPAGRSSHTAVWTGSEMILWGGIVSGPTFLNTGGRYNAGADSWTATTTANAPEARAGHTAVWTGSEMIVWGGQGGQDPLLDTGGRYCGQYPPPTPTPSPTPTLIVTNTNDGGPGSLRQALADANDGDIIGFAVTGTIGLTTGELLVDKNITISGPGAENLAVNGNAKSDLFHISPGETVSISGLTIINGYTTEFGGGIHNDHATLTLNNCIVTANQGGGMYNDGVYPGSPPGATLEINSCSVTENSGRGIYNNAEGGGAAALVIADSILSNNSGNAIYSHGWNCKFCGNGIATVQITNSSIRDNPGGAIYSDTGGNCCSITVSITASTISANAGAGVYNSTLSTTSLSNSTISGNSGGGIYNDLATATGGAYVDNSTMSGNGVEIYAGYNGTYIENTIFNVSPGGHSIVSNFGPVTSNGYNVSSDDGNGYLNSAGDQINTDPLLGPLQDNGGPTFTHALLPGSPAINAGDPNIQPGGYDQRGPGFDRVRGGRIDVGSFEVQNPPAPSPTPRVAPTPRPRPTPVPRP